MNTNILKLLFISLIAFVCLFTNSCEKEQTAPSFSISFVDAGPGGVEISVTTGTTVQIAYSLMTTPRKMDNPSVLFQSGEKITVSTSGPVTLSTKTEIVANTTYYLYLVARFSAADFSQIYSFEFQTSGFDFDQLATVVAAEYNGYKMHLSVPQEVGERKSAIRYATCCLMMYNYSKTVYNNDDYYNLLYNANQYATKDTTLNFTADNNWQYADIDMNEDGVIDENDLDYKWNPVSPGEPTVFLAGQFDWMEIPSNHPSDKNYSVNGFFYPAGFPAGYYLPCLDSAKYFSLPQTKSMNIIGDIDLSQPTDDMWTGAFQRKQFRTKEPEKMDATVKVEFEDVTAVNATLIFTPDPDVEQYAYGIYDPTTYSELLDMLDGKEEYLQWAITSYFGRFVFNARAASGVTEVTLEDLYYTVPYDSEFHVLVTAMGDNGATKQSFVHEVFKTAKKKRRYGPTIEVTEVKDSTTANSAAFNIRCTSVDDESRGKVDDCYYGANSKKEFILSVNGGSSYSVLGQTNRFSQNEIEKINSPEGLTIRIQAIDGETVRLVVVGYNDENTPNDLEYEDILECPAVCDCTTPYLEVDYVDSDLYDELVGEWTATATIVGDSTYSRKMTLSNGFEQSHDYKGSHYKYPYALTDEVYDIYEEYTEWSVEEIDGYFEQFKFYSNEFNERRLEYQNNILMTGWLDEDDYDRLTYNSPWDLFVSTEYDGVDVKTMFFDFGPKMFLEVKENDQLSITGDMFLMPPVAYVNIPFYLAGYNPERSKSDGNVVFYHENYAPIVFPVELSDDKQTLTIKPYVDINGEIWYPNVVGYDKSSSSYIVDNPIISEVVLKRGWDESKASKVMKRSSVELSPVGGDIPDMNYKPMTRFEKPVKINSVNGSVMTMDALQKNYDKLNEIYFNKGK